MSLKTDLINVGCYNILADGWVNPCKPIFQGCWETRKVQLVKRIDDLHLDVICLQEVDRFNDLAHIMWQKGYTGYRVNDKDVAIFFRTERFKVLNKEELHYKDEYWRSALLLRLQSTRTSSTFNIISTHVTWRQPSDIEEMQQLHAFVAEKRSMPTIVCGDLNATPDWIGLKNLCSLGFRDTLRHSTKKTYIDEKRRLDYILVPDSMYVKKTDIDGLIAVLKTKDEPSDHLPITAQILIPSALQTVNQETPNTLRCSLFDSFNEEMKLQPISQEDYNRIATLFQSVLQTGENSDLTTLMRNVDELNSQETTKIFRRAVERYERTQLSRAISLFQQDQKGPACEVFSRLSLETKQAVYFALYEIENLNGRNTSHPNFGAAVFHSFDNLNTSNEIRIQAMERMLLRQALSLFKERLEHEAMPIFEALSAHPIRNGIYGETHRLSQSKGIPTDHSDFGKVAFHSIENFDVDNDLKISAIESYLAKTSA